MPRARALTALLRAAHPVPSLAVTAFGTALGVAAGASADRAALLAAALLTGQLSIGWLNDLLDADADTRARRHDKPLAVSAVARPMVRTALVVAAVLCVPLSLALGWVPGLLHLIAVGSAWSYDAWLKHTVASPLPFAVSFGLLPVIAATTAEAEPSGVLAVAAGLLGVGAHFANTVPDAAADALTGVRGLPQRLGPARSRVVAAAGVVLACGTVLVAGGAALPLPATVLLALASVVGALSPFAPVAWSFRLVLLAAGVAVAGVVAAAVGGPVGG